MVLAVVVEVREVVGGEWVVVVVVEMGVGCWVG